MDDFLNQNPDYLSDYVTNNVSVEQLERWLIRKTHNNRSKKLSLSRYKFCVHADKRKMLQSLTNLLYDMPNKVYVLHELSSTVASAINANNWNLFLYDPISQELKTIENICHLTNRVIDENNNQNTLAVYVSKVKKAIFCQLDQHDNRFPNGAPFAPKNTAYALALPIVQADDTLIGVLELYRKKDSTSFHEEDEEIANSYLVWGGVALHYAELYYNLSQQRKLNTFLLSVVKSIFQDMVNMDSVIAKILEFARNLVNADRTSLFLVDDANNQLYAHIFDVNDNKDEIALKKEIRFPIGSGIAGYVAKTGEPLNIPNAYEDHRFNRQIDQKTGYLTKSLLCMPIFIGDKVIGVLQMVNKKIDVFTKEDEDSFALFATYCGLALDHSRLYEKIHESEQRYKVALESKLSIISNLRNNYSFIQLVLRYHSNCTDEELLSIKKQSIETIPDETLPSFSPYKLTHDEKVLSTIKIMESFSGVAKFDSDDLYRFTLTVRKNYRKVPYHNWAHGYSVAHTIYIFTKNCDNFTQLEKFSFFVSGLCHDLDHRGTNNQFLINSSASLAEIYSTSPLEYHHFNQTVSILQQNGQNILKNMSSEEYKKVLAYIKHCILATDLVKYFTNIAKLKPIIKSGSFDWNNKEHRLLLSAIAMNGADLNSTALPWNEAKYRTKELFEEFYSQGDIELQQGREPNPLMDRRKADEQPKSQVEFLSNITIPCLQVIKDLLPDVYRYLNNCLDNLNHWKELMKAEEQKKEKNKLNVEMPLEFGSSKPINKSSGIERAKSFRL